MDHSGIKEKIAKANTRPGEKVLPLILLLAIGIAAAAYYFIGTGRDTLLAEVEATLYPHKAEVAGKILEMPVDLGAEVKEGDILAVIENSGLIYDIEQMELLIEKQNLALSESQLGAEGSTQAERNLAVAQTAYNSALAVYNKAQNDYKNAEILFQEGAISRDSFENAKLKADNAREALAAAAAQLQGAASQTSAKSAELDLKQNESRLRQMKENLEKYTIRAAVDGTVMSLSYVAGDTVAPGYNLADIAGAGGKYLVFYVPEDRLGQIDYGSEIIVFNKGKRYTGIVKYIDVNSQYTPKDMQTAANKNKESFKIKALLPDEVPLKPGETAEVELKYD